jgi:hypothetical protein
VVAGTGTGCSRASGRLLRSHERAAGRLEFSFWVTVLYFLGKGKFGLNFTPAYQINYCMAAVATGAIIDAKIFVTLFQVVSYRS